MKRIPWLAPIVLAGAALAVREALRAPMWMDEIYTLWASNQGFARAIDIARRDVHPPLHYALVAGWVSLGAASDFWLRAPSIAFGALAIAGTFLLARDMFGRGAGLLAAAMLAIHPQHVHFSQELRSYALLWMLFVWAWWCAWRWVAKGGGAFALGYVTAATLALYTHYFAGIVLACTGLAGLIALGSRPRRAMGWIGLHAAVAALFLPQVPVFIEQNTRLSTEHWIRVPRFGDVVSLVRHLGYGAGYLIPVFGVLAIGPLVRAEHRRAALVLWVAAAGPVALSYFATQAGAHLFSVRYMYFTLPAFCALVAAGVLSLRRGWMRTAMAALVLIVGARAMWLAGPFAESARHERIRAAMAPEVRPGDVLFCGDTHSLLYFRHYMPELRARLLWMRRPVPYFEGRLVIPDSLIVGPEGFARRDSLGTRWWAVRLRHGGTTSDPAADLFDAAAGAPGRQDGPAEWWGAVEARSPKAPGAATSTL